MNTMVRRPMAAQPLGIRHHRFDLLDAAEHRAERDELAVRHARDQAGERGLAHARRPPKDDRGQRVALDLRRSGLPGPEDVLLADVIFERLGPHAIGQRTLLSVRAASGGDGVEQAHGLQGLSAGALRTE